MTSRLILIARNRAFPTLSGARSPSPVALEAAASVVLPANGAAAALPRAVIPPQARNWVHSAEWAPSYDATAEQWISPPSRMTRDAGAAADLRCALPTEEPTHTPVLLKCFGPSASSPAADPQPHAAGHLLRSAVEVFTVALGLTVFGLIAGFFLVLA